jgi:hypothetical protein
MPSVSTLEPYVLTIPQDLFARLAEAATTEGTSPDHFALAALAATVVEPSWKARLRAAKDVAQQAFETSGISDDDLSSDVEAEIKAYRAERAGAVVIGDSNEWPR